MNTFICTRTSKGIKDKPCEEAYQKSFISRDIRTVDDPAKVKAHIGESDWWYSYGTNHRVENGQIVRDICSTLLWVVDISDILDFIKEHEDCILSYSEQCQSYMIEIYDDYRE